MEEVERTMPSARRRPPDARRSRNQSDSNFACSIIAAIIAIAGGIGFYFKRARSNVAAVDLNSPPSPPPILGALEKNVYERELVTRKVEYSSILKEHTGFYFNVSRRLSPGRALGFVSPWSIRGEEVAWRFGSKLTHLSPLMYGVDSKGTLVYHVDDPKRWLDGLREGLTCPGCPPPARLVPQVSLQGLDFASFFTDKEGDADGAREERSGRLLFALLQQAVTLNLDGLILDAHTYLARLDQSTRQTVAPRVHIFVQLLAQQLSVQAQESLDSAGASASAPGKSCCTEGLFLEVPPHPQLFSPAQFKQLSSSLGGVILQTTNYSAVRGQAGPTAPLKWMRDSLGALAAGLLEEDDEGSDGAFVEDDGGRRAMEAALPKLMATLPLLGWDFVLPDGPSNPIGGIEYLQLLEKHKPKRLDWHAEAAEHVFAYRDGEELRHSVYYPSLKTMAERLGMLRSLGVGVAVYELGIGLDYFWDLL